MATKKKVEQSVVTKAAPKAKGRPEPKRVRPSRAKATVSVALEHKQAMRDTSAVVKPLKQPSVRAQMGKLADAIGSEQNEDIFGADEGKDPSTYTPAEAPIRAELAERLAVYQLELEYKHYEDDSNPVASLIKRNAAEAMTQSATISLVLTDITKFVNDGRSASGSGVIELAEGGQLTEELKYYVNEALFKFTSSVNSRITVTRCVVQRFILPGIPFII